jgi:glycosyltransferase involved in cell wall biosynthesis
VLDNAVSVAVQERAGCDDVPPVLFLADHLGYSSGVSHGLTTYFLNVLPALAQAGVDLTACFMRESHKAGDVLRAHGIETVFLGAGKLDPLVTFQIASIARRRGCRILHAAQMKASLAARIVAPLVGARTIVHVHDLNRMGPIVKSLHGLFSRTSDLGLCVADVVHDVAVGDYSVRRERVRTLHNSLQLELFRSVSAGTRSKLRDELDIPPQSPVLGLVGRMFPVKGHRQMLEMLPAILQRMPDAVLLLVGDGPERPRCEALATELGLHRNVRFAGQRNDVAKLLKACDLIVVPSESEGLPLTAIEAMAAGLPVVAFDVGGMSEVVDDGVTGAVVAAGDSAAFTAAVLSLLEDPVKRSTFGASAAAAAERFGIERHVERLLGHYRELASGISPVQRR